MRTHNVRLSVTLVCLLAFAICSSAARANDWDERLEGTLPLPVAYTYEVTPPNHGVSSIVCDTGEIALHLVDADSATRQSRINRGNWYTVSGVTLHLRFRVLYADADVMTFQLNDGMSEGRLALRWNSGQMRILYSTPDSGQPTYVPAPTNTWVELWIKILNYRYSIWTFSGGSWNLYSVGSTPSGSGGVVYLGSASTTGMGAMDIDFYRLETTGGYAPGDANAPCILPSNSLAVGVTANPITVGQSTTITVASSEKGVNYQLRVGANNVGSPVAGTGGTIHLPTGPLTTTTTFNVLAVSSSGGNCSQQLSQTQTVIVATPCSTIAQAKSYADGTLVKLTDKPVSGSLGSAYWLEETDRSNGIKISSTSSPPAGRRMTVIGTLATTTGERRLDGPIETQGSSGSAPSPLYLGSRDLGGAALNAQSPGVTGGTGPNNIGLLVRMWGRVRAVSPGAYYYLDDGFGWSDGTTTGGVPNIGVRVLADPGSIAVNDFISVTGASTTFLGSSQIQRAIIPVVTDCTPPNSGLSVGATANPICAGQSTSITVANSEVGVNYQLRNNADNSNVGSPVAGTGGTINLPTGALTTTTTFNVRAVNVLGGCAVQLTQTKTITVNTLPNAGLTVRAYLNPVYSGESSAVLVDASEIGVNYQLRIGASNVGIPVAGDGGTVGMATGPITSATTYNVLATKATTGCSVQLNSTMTISVGTRNKFGIHFVCCSSDVPHYTAFLQQCAQAGKPVAVVKCLDDFWAAKMAKQYSPATLTIGRINELDGINLQGLNEYLGMTPADAAADIYSHLKPVWTAHPEIDVWEICNEWANWIPWQTSFYIAMMDLAEADGFRIALYSCSVGTPPQSYYSEVARACARAKASGNHIMSLHEYGLDGLLRDAGPYLVTRYRMLYDYLAQQNAVVPLAITEAGQYGGGGIPTQSLFVDDYAWYDSQMRQDSYVIGCAAWILGDSGWGGANFDAYLPAMGNYIVTH